MTELLRSRSHGHEAALDEIDAAIARATGLARQLLTISRNDPMRPKLVDLNEIACMTGRLAALGGPVEIAFMTRLGDSVGGTLSNR